jgi:hypothetical protein
MSWGLVGQAPKLRRKVLDGQNYNLGFRRLCVDHAGSDDHILKLGTF